MAATKKTTKATAKRPTAKKATAKKATAKKATAKKATAKKAVAKKAVAKKAVAKKAVAKKAVAKKPTAKKPTAKKPTAKKPTAKKAVAKKAVAKKPTAKKATAVAPTTPAVAPATPAVAPPAAPQAAPTSSVDPALHQQRLTHLQGKSIAELKNMLRTNDQLTTGTKPELVARVLDRVENGNLPRCTKCYIGRLRIIAGTFSCPGGYDDDEYVACDFTASITEVERPEWQFTTPGLA